LKNRINTIAGLFFGMIIPIATYAQKHNEQGLKVPAQVKIDGKLKEWTPESYNSSTMLYYIVANNADNIYLALKCTDKQTQNKILAGGITFALNADGKKKDQEAPAVTFPLVTPGAGRAMRMGGRRFGGGVGQESTNTDSAIAAAHKQAIASFKEIGLTRLTGITDSVVSIYNDHAIKAAINFDDKGDMVYELAVPLKALGIVTPNAKELAFNIRVNGLQLNNNGSSQRRNARFAGSGGGGMMEMALPTDFWGKYRLAQ
jgi:hypothetical protein